MKVLITGHTGYLGSILLKLLLNNGFEVTGLSRNNLSYVISSKRFHEIIKDLKDVDEFDFEGIDTVIHLAGIARNVMIQDLAILQSQNYDLAIRIAILAKQSNVKRFLFPSSAGVYGYTHTLAKETTAIHPLTAYSHIKYHAEQTISQLSSPHFCPVFLRNATFYGYAPTTRFDLVLNDFVLSAFTKHKILLHGDGNARRTLIHVADAAKVFMTILKAPETVIHNQIFNVGAIDEHYTIIELAEIVQKLIPNTKIQLPQKPIEDPRSLIINSTKLFQSFPNLRLDWTVKKGIQQLIKKLKKYPIIE